MKKKLVSKCCEHLHVQYVHVVLIILQAQVKNTNTCTSTRTGVVNGQMERDKSLAHKIEFRMTNHDRLLWQCPTCCELSWDNLPTCISLLVDLADYRIQELEN